MNTKLSYFYVSLSVFFWASSAAVSKLLLTKLDNLQVLFFSTLFASISLLIISFSQGKFAVVKTYTLKDYAIFAFMGFVGVFLYRFFLQAALLLMPAQEAFIVNYTRPIMVVVFAWIILKEKMTWKKSVALLLSFLGVVIVTTKGNFSTLSFSIGGVLSALAGAVLYGLYSVLGKRQSYEKFTSTTFFYIFSFVFSAISLSLFSSLPSLSLAQWGGLLRLGIFPSGLAFVFWLLALKYGDTVKISNLIFLTPFLSLVYIYFLLGEKILLSSVLGLVLIVLGIVIQSFKRNYASTNNKH